MFLSTEQITLQLKTSKSLTQMYFLVSQVLCKFNGSPGQLSSKYQRSDHFHLVSLLSQHLACKAAMSGD